MSQLRIDTEALYASVNQTADSLGYDIQANIYYAWKYFQQMYMGLFGSWSPGIVIVGNFVMLMKAYLQTILGNLMINIESRLKDIDLALSQVFGNNLWPVVSRVVQAIDEIETGTDLTLADVEAIVNRAKGKMTTDLTHNINVLRGELNIKTAAVESNLRDEIEFIEEDVYEIEVMVEEALEPEVGTIWESITTTADEIYDWTAIQLEDTVSVIGEAVTNVTTWATEQFNVAVQAIGDLKAYLLGQIGDSYFSLKAWFNSNINILKGLIDAGIDKASEALEVAKDYLTAAYDSLAQLVDWRFIFLNLFMSYPELSFLPFINRDEATFNRFKPYWQAFIIRVLMP